MVLAPYYSDVKKLLWKCTSSNWTCARRLKRSENRRSGDADESSTVALMGHSQRPDDSNFVAQKSYFGLLKGPYICRTEHCFRVFFILLSE